MPTLTIPLKLNENAVVSFDFIYKVAENRYSLSHWSKWDLPFAILDIEYHSKNSFSWNNEKF